MRLNRLRTRRWHPASLYFSLMMYLNPCQTVLGQFLFYPMMENSDHISSYTNPQPHFCECVYFIKKPRYIFFVAVKRKCLNELVSLPCHKSEESGDCLIFNLQFVGLCHHTTSWPYISMHHDVRKLKDRAWFGFLCGKLRVGIQWLHISVRFPSHFSFWACFHSRLKETPSGPSVWAVSQ